MRQFRIDDSERNRILNLHESATKRQYLKEENDKCVTSVINDVEGIRNFLPIELKTIKSLNKEYNITDKITICFGQGGEVFTYEKNPIKGFKNFKIEVEGDKLRAISTGAA
jgi:hypothetical protein